MSYQKPLPVSLPAYQAAERSIVQADYSPEGRIDLNTASLEQLMSLPGIGEKTAEAILALREQMGFFRYPEDLLRVKGIGESKLYALTDWIYVQPVQERNRTDGNTGSLQ